MLKVIVGGFLAVSLSVIGGLIYDAIARGGGLTSWILTVVWTVATVLIIGALLRGAVRQHGG